MPPHTKGFHDGIVAIARIDQYRVLSAQYQKAVSWNPANAPTVVAQHQEAAEPVAEAAS